MNKLRIIFISSLSRSTGSLPQFIVKTILCENPVVSIDVGSIREIIKHNFNEFVYKPFNTNIFANGIKFCMDNIKKEFKKNIERILLKCLIKKILKDYKKIIDKVINYES